jgi:ketosteroid isomerase-like protein
LTPKTTGQRMTMDEMGIYAVENGKIVSERFFCLQA